MRRLIYFSAIILITMLLSSCKDEVTGANNNPLLKGKSSDEFTGPWVLKQYEDSLTVMKRADKLEDDNYGFILQPGGIFIERKNTSWCGTPPVVYSNYEGSWQVESDSVLNVTVGYWGGTLIYKMIITGLSENEMSYYIEVNN